MMCVYKSVIIHTSLCLPYTGITTGFLENHLNPTYTCYNVDHATMWILTLIGASCWICYFNQPWIWMTTGCVITHKYSHHVTLLGYMGVGFVWDNCVFFDYRITNKLIFIHQTLIQPCVPTANDVILWDAGHWILHNNFSTPYSGSQLTSIKIP